MSQEFENYYLQTKGASSWETIEKAQNENEMSITDWNAVETKATELQTAKDNEVQAKADLKASAKQKLMNGEALTEDEANVMVGL